MVGVLGSEAGFAGSMLYDACTSLPRKSQAAIKWLKIRKKKKKKLHFHKHIKKEITHFEGDCKVIDKGLQVKQPPRECVSRHI